MELEKNQPATKGVLTIESPGCSILEDEKSTLAPFRLLVDVDPSALN